MSIGGIPAPAADAIRANDDRAMKRKSNRSVRCILAGARKVEEEN